MEELVVVLSENLMDWIRSSKEWFDPMYRHSSVILAVTFVLCVYFAFRHWRVRREDCRQEKSWQSRKTELLSEIKKIVPYYGTELERMEELLNKINRHDRDQNQNVLSEIRDLFQKLQEMVLQLAERKTATVRVHKRGHKKEV